MHVCLSLCFRVAYFEIRCFAPEAEYSYFLRTLVFALSPLLVLVLLFGCAYAVAAFQSQAQQAASPFQSAIKNCKGNAVILLFLLLPGDASARRIAFRHHIEHEKYHVILNVPALTESTSKLLSCVRLGANEADWLWLLLTQTCVHNISICFVCTGF